jgi:hypothetical protein
MEEIEIWTVNTSNGEPKWEKGKFNPSSYYCCRLVKIPLAHLLLNELHQYFSGGRFIVLSKEIEEELGRIGESLLFEDRNPPAFNMLNLLFGEAKKILGQVRCIPRVVLIDENCPRYWNSNLDQVLRLAIEVPTEEGCILK